MKPKDIIGFLIGVYVFNTLAPQIIKILGGAEKHVNPFYSYEFRRFWSLIEVE